MDMPKHYHGVCVGGPFDCKHLSEAGVLVSTVAVERDNPKRSIPAQQASTVERPCLFGDYLFDETGKAWVWDDSSLRETRIPVDKSER